ncbi:hypothetical protein [Chthonobacter albigriseus]|uniref:hypothetical protein n=1 Tax=Chthonobacter albigriseus TaxID=1683161 RepID=UPI0015EEC7E6|nr:hypothetical protein [Chthonobacter albigriseus]
MKTRLSLAALATCLLAPSLASAETVTYYDPTESDFVTIERPAVPALPDAPNYTRVITYYDPSEGDFVTVPAGEQTPPEPRRYTGPTERYYDPSEGEFIQLPAR